MKITKALFVPGVTAFFFDDQLAIKDGAEQDGFTYRGAPKTPGFTAIRQAGECISIMLLLENGEVAVGDAAAVQYSGACGRDPLFLAASYLPLLEREIAPLLEGCELDSFRRLAQWVDTLEIDGRPLHTALRYGLSQALLDAVARARRTIKAEIVCREYDLPRIAEPVPIFGQTGDDRYVGVDKMILKQVDVLPHGLLNNVRDKIAADGAKLRQYLGWLAGRIRSLRLDPEYRPDIHLDVYGNLGRVFDNDPKRIAGFIASLAEEAAEFPLYIEGPVDMGSKAGQIEVLAAIREHLDALGSGVKIVADEWCNTFADIRDFTDARCCHMVQIKTPDLGSIHNVVEGILYCKAGGMEAYQGGTCNETDISARCCVHLALAARSERLLAKPGMGFDEGFMIVSNEMARTLALMRHLEEG